MGSQGLGAEGLSRRGLRAWGLGAVVLVLLASCSAPRLLSHSTPQPFELLGDGLEDQAKWLDWVQGPRVNGELSNQDLEADGRRAEGRGPEDVAPSASQPLSTLSKAVSSGLRSALNGIAGVQCDSACMKDMMIRARRGARRQVARMPRVPNPVMRLPPGSQLDAPDAVAAAAYRDVGAEGFEVAPQLLGQLASYVPLAVSTEKKLYDALEDAGSAPDSKKPKERSQFQYGQELQDEYDAASQKKAGRFFDEDDVPKLKCPGQFRPGKDTDQFGQYKGKLDRFGDCELTKGKQYNRMFYVDREQGDKYVSHERIHRHMQGVKKLVDGWKHLLVGKVPFDDAYYWCYSQYQEDPEFSTCLRDLAEYKDEFKLHRWANDVLTSGGEIRRGFPDLRMPYEEDYVDLKPEDEKPHTTIDPDSLNPKIGGSAIRH